MGKIKILSSIDVNKIISGSTCVASPMICGTSCLLIGSATSPQITTKLTGSTNVYLRSACSDPGITIYWNGTQGTRIDDNQIGIPSTSAPTFYVNNYTAGNGNVCISKTTGLTTIGGCMKLATVPACSASESTLFINGGGCIVSGTSSGGGINWDGTTANGIGTYVSSTCICSEPTLIYDGLNLQFANGQTRCVSMAAAPASGSSHLYICGAPMSASGSAAGNVKIFAGCSNYSSAALGGVAALCGGDASSAASGIGQGGAVCVIAGCGYMGGTGVYACGGNSYFNAGNSCAPNFCSKGGSVCICGGCSTGSTYSYGGAIYLRSGNARSTVIPITDNYTGGGSFNIYAGDARGTCGVIPACGIAGGSVNINAGCGIASSGATYGGTITMYAGNACGSANCISNGGCLCFIGGRAWGNGGCVNVWGGQSECKGNAGDVCILGGYASHCYGNGGNIIISGGISCGWNSCHAGDVCICGGAGWGRADGGDIYLKRGTVCAGSTGATGNIYIQNLPTGNTVGVLLIESTGKVVSGETTDISGSLGTGQLLCYNGSTIIGTSDICMCSTASRYICMGSTTTSPACALTIQGTSINAATGTAGFVNICGGVSSGTSTNIGGYVNIYGGCACNTSTGVACGGYVKIFGGDTYDANNNAINIGGCLCIRGGNAKCVSGSGSYGGTITICGGSGTTGGNLIICGGYGVTGGGVSIYGGDGTTTDGNVCIYAGGDIVMVACQNSGSGYATLYYNGIANLCTASAGPCAIGILCATTCGTAPDWIATSDIRLKKDVQPISNALSLVIKLQGVSYCLCDDCTCEKQLGLIAQDVVCIIPELVSHTIPSEEDAKYGITDEKLGLKYDKITAVLIEAIKEQQTQINELKLEIERIKIC